MARFDLLSRGLFAALAALTMPPASGLDATRAGTDGPAMHLPGAGPTCALLGYVCNATLTSRVLAPPPAAASSIASYVAYT